MRNKVLNKLNGLLLALALPVIFTSCVYAGEPDVITDEQAPSIVIIDDGKIAQGVTLHENAMADMQDEQINEIINQSFADKAEDYSVKLVYGDNEDVLSAEYLGITADLQATKTQAMAIGRSGNIDQRLQEVEKAKNEGIEIEPQISLDLDNVKQKTREYAENISPEPSQEDVVFKPETEERFEFTQQKDGFIPEVEEFTKLVVDEVENKAFGVVQIPGEAIKPEGEATGVLENTVLISSFTTEYKGSSQNRIHNIRVAAENLNGTIAQPGEVISANEQIGPRTSAKIWRPAPAIENKVYKNHLGGGVCQVSTTLFNSVAMADLEIAQWIHHSWPSTYVDIGCDATISTGGPDFKFKNNTDWPIYIVAYANTNEHTITVETWGRPLADGNSIKITGVRTGTTGVPATPVYVNSAADTGRGRIGQYSITYKTYYDKDGKEIKKEVIDKHYYPAVAPRVVKPAETAPPVPEPVETPDIPEVETPPAPTQAPEVVEQTPAPPPPEVEEPEPPVSE